jgi:hypothetical protein
MATECERLFSGAGNLVDDRKNSYCAETIEAIECLRGWVKQGAIQVDSEVQEAA